MLVLKELCCFHRLWMCTSFSTSSPRCCCPQLQSVRDELCTDWAFVLTKPCHLLIIILHCHLRSCQYQFWVGSYLMCHEMKWNEMKWSEMCTDSSKDRIGCTAPNVLCLIAVVCECKCWCSFSHLTGSFDTFTMVVESLFEKPFYYFLELLTRITAPAVSLICLILLFIFYC